MSMGQIAKVFIPSEWAYGEPGFPPMYVVSFSVIKYLAMEINMHAHFIYFQTKLSTLPLVIAYHKDPT